MTDTGTDGAATSSGSATAELRAARDRLTELRTDYAEAVATFRWPDVGDAFNWVHDWFDTWARGNDRRRARRRRGGRQPRGVLLRRPRPTAATRSRACCPTRACARATASSSCSATRSSSGSRCSRSSRSAPSSCRPRPRSARPSWSTGSPAAMPRRSSATPPTPRSSTRCPGDYAPVRGRSSRRRARRRYASAYDRPADAGAAPGQRHVRPDAPLLHLRDDEPSQARRAHAPDLPRRAPVDDVLARPRARRRAPQHLLARVGEARLVELLRALARRGDGAGLQLRPLRPCGAPRADPARGRHDLLCPADGVADAHQRRPHRRAGRAA